MVKKTVRAHAINRYWAAHRADKYDLWTVTHRLTGYSAGYVATLAIARSFALALMRAYRPDRWDFYEPEQARGMKRAGQLRRRFERMHA